MTRIRGSASNVQVPKTIYLHPDVNEAIVRAAHERQQSQRYIIDAALRRYLKVKP